MRKNPAGRSRGGHRPVTGPVGGERDVLGNRRGVIQHRAPSRSSWMAWGPGLMVLGALLAVPPFLPRYWLEVLIGILFTAYLGAAWNVLGGYAGQCSFGHAAFFGIGAYTSTLLLLRLGVSPWLGLVAGGLLAMAFGLFQGYLSFRYGLRGPYFSLVTLAF